MPCNSNCNNDLSNCPEGVCPDFRLKRHDTKPDFEIIVSDCGDPIDLTDAAVEVSMWTTAKLKAAVADTDTYFAVADNLGFNQAMVGDVIVMEQTRAPEQMLITGFDETNYLIRVERGYHGTTPRDYKKGSKLKIFRFISSVGETEMTTKNIENLDGTTEEDVLVESKLIYEWNAQDTCLPGCYYLEIKLLKMSSDDDASLAAASSLYLTSTSIIPSFSTPDATDLGCALGDGVEWVRRFPVDKSGYLIQIVDSPTTETLSA